MEVIIIGSGLAGLSAALHCAENGVQAVLVSPQPSHCSQSVLASGGINAVLYEQESGDSITEHIEDTWNAGCHLADRRAIERLATNAAPIIHYLQKCGVIFTQDEEGRVAQRYFGGQKKKRTCYSHSGIGKQMMTGLEQRIRYYCDKGLIRIMDHYLFLTPILTQKNADLTNREVCGAIIAEVHSGQMSYLQGPVIVASGGMNQLMGNTTGSIHSDGSVTAALYAAGVTMANLEMIQYHPTTVRTACKNMLISEAARGEGGRLFAYRNGERWYFCEEWFGPNGNLMPRDIVSRAIDRVLREKLADDTDHVWLDISHLGLDVINDKLAEVRTLCLDYLNLDPIHYPIPVVPGVHYFMGGIWTDCDHRTSMKGLYAAGECCYQYHGANRLGGNSTLGAIYGGMCAANSVCEDSKTKTDDNAKSTENNDRNHFNQDFISLAEQTINRLHLRLSAFTKDQNDAEQMRLDLQNMMQSCMGITRDESGLQDGLSLLSDWQRTNGPLSNFDEKLQQPRDLQMNYNLTSIYRYQTYLLSELGVAMVQSALDRKESRGAHYRTDYPKTLEEYEKPTLVKTSGK